MRKKRESERDEKFETSLRVCAYVPVFQRYRLEGEGRINVLF